MQKSFSFPRSLLLFPSCKSKRIEPQSTKRILILKAALKSGAWSGATTIRAITIQRKCESVCWRFLGHPLFFMRGTFFFLVWTSHCYWPNAWSNTISCVNMREFLVKIGSFSWNTSNKITSKKKIKRQSILFQTPFQLDSRFKCTSHFGIPIFHFRVLFGKNTKKKKHIFI